MQSMLQRLTSDVCVYACIYICVCVWSAAGGNAFATWNKTRIDTFIELCRDQSDFGPITLGTLHGIRSKHPKFVRRLGSENKRIRTERYFWIEPTETTKECPLFDIVNFDMADPKVCKTKRHFYALW